MNTPAQTEQIAVICERGGNDAAGVESYLRTQGLQGAVWYAPRDVDDVDQAVRAGQVRRVVFSTIAEFSSALWTGSLTVACWLAPGVRVEIAAQGENWTSAQLAALLTCWAAVHRRQRRARAVAGLLLSVVVVAAAFTLLATAR